MGKFFGRSRLALLLMMILTLALPPALANGAMVPAAGEPDTSELTVFDLKTFIAAQPTSKLSYDYLKLATALQGVVNRTNTQLYYFYESNSIAKEAGMDIDHFWLDELRKEGGALAARTLVTAASFSAVLDQFASAFNGVVVWDQNVPATANVASTATGAENLLPVRFDETPGSPYDELVVKRQMPVAVNLVGKFTGQGTIPDTDLASTGSAKNDAYLWAKVRYLDSGLTNPTMMAYGLDGVSWSINQSAKDLSAQVISIAMPAKLKVGQEIEVAVTFKNIGKTTWTMAANDRLGSLGTNQFKWGNLNGGFSNDPANQRVFMSANEQIASGQQKTFRFTIIAPNAPGVYKFDADMVRDGVTWYGASIQRTVEVTAEGQSTVPPAEVPVPQEGQQFVYPDLFNSFLPNADYFIANKAFFFDLSPDETTKPIDDRNQPLGTDYNTLIELLRSQNARAGETIFTIGGFVPWWIKYTKHADSQAGLEPVQAEWKYADIISKYNAQKDADAYGLIGLSNASAFKNVPLNETFTQKNDKGNNGKTYDPATKYVAFYMGDYDAGAWTAGALPALWNDPKRGELPLAWPPVMGLSKRIPQLFNYLYETMSPNDYFVAGDNGAGYLNPIMLLEENRPDGLPEFLHVWEQYNTEMYDKFDIDITGFLISGNSGSVPLRVQESYSRFSPNGVGNNGGFEQPVVNGTPFAWVQDLGQEVRDAAVYGEQIAAQLKKNQKFFMFRNILTKPSMVVDAVNYVKEHYPELKFEVVDPYTYFRFYKEAKPWEVKAPITYESQEAKAAIAIDGVAVAGEWDDAAEIIVSPESEDVIKHGTVWGAETDAQDITSKYRIKWDDNNLYLLEERTDDAQQFTETGSKMYLSDATLLFLDLDRGKNGTAFRDGDYSVFLTPSGPDGQPHMFMREGHNGGVQEFPYTDGTIASTVRTDGYTMEVAIPWSSLQIMPFSPADGKTVGMTLLATDNDGPGNWGQIMWLGDGDNQLNWGDMKFVAKPIATPAEGIAKLRELIETGNVGSVLKSNLLQRLEQANKQLGKSNNNAAAAQFNGFRSNLNADGMQSQITPELKAKLLELADQVVELIEAL
ncbi:sugar-binding protein [Paenibacillus spongiae]|uniref:Carbohydrate-binding domain-containing protein n=1 Tax=Paenibacillus spongiae TaxID=2909671 RepID=A0ABY5S0J2_9BACL|nr:sugar-binding protein [Paenibacillus spongiae]UVI27362.1 hypothetical protein L1F29_17965 [Paenibacillus spongiae]